MTGKPTNPVLQNLLAELLRDKKKSAVLGVLLLVAAVVLVKAFSGAGKPSAASAAPMNAWKQPAAMTDAPRDEAAQNEFKAQARRNQYIRQMDGSITRDLFLAGLEFFPRKHEEPVKVMPTTTLAPATDEQEAARQLVRADARSLVLESTMVGASSVASINGKILRAGEWFSGFEVVEITSHNCLVRKRGVTVVLEINK